jgi:hypothetical protein
VRQKLVDDMTGKGTCGTREHKGAHGSTSDQHYSENVAEVPVFYCMGRRPLQLIMEQGAMLYDLANLASSSANGRRHQDKRFCRVLGPRTLGLGHLGGRYRSEEFIESHAIASGPFPLCCMEFTVPVLPALPRGAGWWWMKWVVFGQLRKDDESARAPAGGHAFRQMPRTLEEADWRLLREVVSSGSNSPLVLCCTLAFPLRPSEAAHSTAHLHEVSDGRTTCRCFLLPACDEQSKPGNN